MWLHILKIQFISHTSCSSIAKRGDTYLKSSTWEAEAGDGCQVKSGLIYKEFQYNQGYTV